MTGYIEVINHIALLKESLGRSSKEQRGLYLSPEDAKIMNEILKQWLDDFKKDRTL